MFLTVHVLVGALVVEKLDVQSGFLAFVAGFISHFFVDVIPHGDEHLDGHVKSSNPIRAIFPWLVADLVVLSLVAGSLFFVSRSLFRIPVFLAMVASMVPDALQAVHYSVIPIPRYLGFHDWFHRLIGKEIGIRRGLIVQTTFVGLLIAILLR